MQPLLPLDQPRKTKERTRSSAAAEKKRNVRGKLENRQKKNKDSEGNKKSSNLNVCLFFRLESFFYSWHVFSASKLEMRLEFYTWVAL